MILENDTLRLLRSALDTLDQGFASLPEISSAAPDARRMEAVLGETAVRLRDNYPFFHPQYAGQMLKPPHPIARAAYALAT